MQLCRLCGRNELCRLNYFVAVTDCDEFIKSFVILHMSMFSLFILRNAC